MDKKNILKLVMFAAFVAIILVLPNLHAHAQMSTTTLGTAIDNVNTTSYDYFTVLLNKYWPFVVGFLILLGVWHYGKSVVQGFK